jgi:hypothetical protein
MSQVATSALNIGFPKGVRADSTSQPVDNAFRQLREECQAQQALYEAQPISARRLLAEQARKIAEALVQGQRQLSFTLPEQVSTQTLSQRVTELIVPAEFRTQVVAGRLGRLPAKDIRAAIRHRLNQLEQSHYPAVAVSARLIRYATVSYIVRDMLPAGDSVNDATLENADAAAVARRFYMPQWIAFDDDRLLVDSLQEAEARVAAMQNYVSALHLAVSLAPYIFADEEYQRKRSGMLVQLINQGRALTRYQIGIIVGKLQRYAEAGCLNRGLSLSLPYFDDQTLEMKMWDLEVIPAGRTMFVPAFVVLAARREQERVQQDAQLSQSTRMHLLAELKELERAFDANRGQAN